MPFESSESVGKSNAVLAQLTSSVKALLEASPYRELHLREEKEPSPNVLEIAERLLEGPCQENLVPLKEGYARSNGSDYSWRYQLPASNLVETLFEDKISGERRAEFFLPFLSLSFHLIDCNLEQDSPISLSRDNFIPESFEKFEARMKIYFFSPLLISRFGPSNSAVFEQEASAFTLMRDFSFPSSSLPEDFSISEILTPQGFFSYVFSADSKVLDSFKGRKSRWLTRIRRSILKDSKNFEDTFLDNQGLHLIDVEYFEEGGAPKLSVDFEKLAVLSGGEGLGKAVFELDFMQPEGGFRKGALPVSIQRKPVLARAGSFLLASSRGRLGLTDKETSAARSGLQEALSLTSNFIDEDLITADLIRAESFYKEASKALAFYEGGLPASLFSIMFNNRLHLRVRVFEAHSRQLSDTALKRLAELKSYLEATRKLAEEALARG